MLFRPPDPGSVTDRCYSMACNNPAAYISIRIVYTYLIVQVGIYAPPVYRILYFLVTRRTSEPEIGRLIPVDTKQLGVSKNEWSDGVCIGREKWILPLLRVLTLPFDSSTLIETKCSLILQIPHGIDFFLKSSFIFQVNS